MSKSWNKAPFKVRSEVPVTRLWLMLYWAGLIQSRKTENLP
ncbi:MAG: hypothetical protein QXN53_06805 [Thermoproteota archaeon]